MHGRKPHFYFSHVFLFITEKRVITALFLTPYLKSDKSYLSLDVKCIFVAPLVLEIYSFSYKYAECAKVESEHSKIECSILLEFYCFLLLSAGLKLVLNYSTQSLITPYPTKQPSLKKKDFGGSFNLQDVKEYIQQFILVPDMNMI